MKCFGRAEQLQALIARTRMKHPILDIKRIAKNTWLILSAIRLTPHYLLTQFHPNRKIIRLDLERWAEEKLKITITGVQDAALAFFRLMTCYTEYRNVFYHRLGWKGKLVSLLCRPMPSLVIYTHDIGPGLFIQHGIGTIISAHKIGCNCWINQQVTIGFTNDTDCPSLGSNVTIYAGAKVLGSVHVGDNSIIGANAVVVKDVPSNCTVVGVPANIIRRDGKKVKEPL